MDEGRWQCPDCGRSFLRRNARHSCVARTPADVLGHVPGGMEVLASVQGIVASWPGTATEATRTQVAFGAHRRFAWLWVPRDALGRGAWEVCLSFALPRREASPRIKESVEASPGWWTHHVMVPDAEAVDSEVRAWLREAYETRGRR